MPKPFNISYKPDIAVRDIAELKSKLKGKKTLKCMYNLDMVIITPLSMDVLHDYCSVLTSLVNDSTSIFINGELGCELEVQVIRNIRTTFKVVATIFCNPYTGLISAGITYSQYSQSENLAFLRNMKNFINMSQKREFIHLERKLAECGLTLKTICDPTKMSKLIWRYLIPQFSINLLYFINDKTEIEKILFEEPNSILFYNIVTELINLCRGQCNSDIEEYIGDGEIKLSNVLKNGNNRLKMKDNPPDIVIDQLLFFGRKYNVDCYNLETVNTKFLRQSEFVEEESAEVAVEIEDYYLKLDNLTIVSPNDVVEKVSPILTPSPKIVTVEKKSPIEMKQKIDKEAKYKIWKLQRQWYINNGILTRQGNGPYEDLLKYIDIINKSNMNNVISYTTSRYGAVDTYETIKRDKEKIMVLFQNRYKEKQIQNGE